MNVPVVHSRRLDLVSMSPEFLGASLQGRRQAASGLLGATLPLDWPAGTERSLRRRLDQLALDPTQQPWLLRGMVLRENSARPLVGYINFHSPPGPEGWAEIGYTVLPNFRRRGYAEESVEAMFDWAGREHGVRRFRASVSPNNHASLALVRKLGFGEIGSQWDEEDGVELVFELERPPESSAVGTRRETAEERSGF